MKRIPRRAALAVTLLLSTLVIAADGDDKSAIPSGLMGAVRSVGEDKKSFSFKAKKGPYEVTWTDKTVWRSHEVKKLDQLSSGTEIHVLGHVQPSSPGSGGGNFPPQLIKIQAIVVGAEFVPPPVTEKQLKQNISWLKGKYQLRDREVLFDDAVIGGGKGREVLIEKVVEGGEVKKREALFVSGHLNATDRKNKLLKATEILFVAPKFKGYDVTHDLKNRKPKKKLKPSGFGY